MSYFKQFIQCLTDYKIKQNPTLAENKDIDNNCILILCYINYGLRTFFLIGNIFTITMMIGIAWFILCDIFSSHLFH